MSYSPRFLFIVVVAVVCAGCTSPNDDSPSLFMSLEPERTGIDFSNELSPSTNLNMINYIYYYNGGGVAVGDVNGDGLIDVYFTANENANRLYLNQGNFRFKDVTERAEVAGTADWTTGVSMADVNGDGRLDIYVSVMDGYKGLEGHNQLFINQGTGEDGVPRFEEKAKEYRLDQRALGTHSLFFDYDLDGDLDVYLLNSSVHRATMSRSRDGLAKNEQAGDRLYRNDGDTFTEVTDEAGLHSSRLGYGLGVAATDLDGNGCPDLYVANDFIQNDYLYYNNCDGTFTEAIDQATRHVSYSSMGVDAADYNNDGRPDVAVLDMLPTTTRRLKTTDVANNYDTQRMKQMGYHYQYRRNTLQLNRGNKRFSEIGLLADMAATDWSWAPLFADFNNDGRKDLFVTNGIYQRPNDLDYIEHASQPEVMRSISDGMTKEDLKMRERMPHEPVSNFAFSNEGDLTFADSTAAWGLDQPSFSNGAAYADLNNDGSLDLVVNNVNAPASIYKNRADSLRDHHFLTVRLKGDGKNTQGIGTEVKVYQEDRLQMLEQMPSRGFQSSVDPRLHFGLGTRTIDSLTVTWPDGRTETRTSVSPDQILTLHQSVAKKTPLDSTPLSPPPLFQPVEDALGIDFRHRENPAYDLEEREPLLPHTLSTEGPALAVGDVNGDGRDDVFLGGAKRQSAALYIQEGSGRFQRSTPNDTVWGSDQLREDVDATFFDANGDGALDLYVVSAGNEFWGRADALRDRLYLNDGTGTFQKANGALPDRMTINGGTVAPGDFDNDGDMDLFVGSRVVARRYGKTPNSYLLENDGTGHFEDVTDELAPALRNVGMVTDATWTNVRGSEALDLIVVGEWMPITVFEQKEGRLVNQTDAAGLSQTSGWWNAIHLADVNGDGYPDLLAGNLGNNSRLRATPQEPARLYLNNFDRNDGPDPILTYYRNGKSYPHAGRDVLLERFPFLKEKFPTYESFGTSQLGDIFSETKIRNATMKVVHTFASSYFQNQGDGTFAARALPSRAQFSPVHDILSHDLDGNGREEVVMGGNFYGVKSRQGRYDASYGTLLRHTDDRWTAMPAPKSNLYLSGQIRALRILRGDGGSLYLLAARNDAQPQVLCLRSSSTRDSS